MITDITNFCLFDLLSYVFFFLFLPSLLLYSFLLSLSDFLYLRIFLSTAFEVSHSISKLVVITLSFSDVVVVVVLFCFVLPLPCNMYICIKKV